MSDKHTDYLVTEYGGKAPHKIIWHPKEPLPIGFPPRWILKHTDQGVVLCQKHRPEGRELVVPETMISTGQVMRLNDARDSQGGPPIQFAISRLNRPLPLFAPLAVDYSTENELYFFCGIGDQLLTYRRIDTTYTLSIRSQMVFNYTRTIGGHRLMPYAEGLTFETVDGKITTFSPNKCAVLTDLEFSRGTLRWEDHWWQAVFVPVNAEFGLTRFEKKHPKEDLWLSRMTKISVGLCLGLALLVKVFKLDQPKKKIVEQTQISLKEPKWIEPKPEPIPPKPPPPKVVALPPKPKPVAKRAESAKPPAPKAAPPKATVRTTPRPTRTEAAAPPKQAAPQPVVDTTAQEQAEVAKALSFLSTPSSKRAAGSVGDPSKASQSAEARYAKNSSTKLNVKETGSALSEIENVSGKADPIETRSSRTISREGGSGGDLRGGGKVQGKVSLNSVYSGSGGLGDGEGGGLALSGTGQVSEAELAKTLEKHLNRFQYCYEKALLADPKLTGIVRAQWTISESGAVSGARVVRSQLNQDGLHSCLVRELGKIRFPKPTGGSVIVTYPFSFTSTSL